MSSFGLTRGDDQDDEVEELGWEFNTIKASAVSGKSTIPKQVFVIPPPPPPKQDFLNDTLAELQKLYPAVKIEPIYTCLKDLETVFY